MRKWSDYCWPEWVPKELRKQIERFWLESWGRGPDAWEKYCNEDLELSRVFDPRPALGDVVTVGNGNHNYTGRLVPAWNNMGRLVFEDGSFTVIYYAKPYSSARIAKRIARLEAKRDSIQEEIEELANEFFRAKSSEKVDLV